MNHEEHGDGGDAGRSVNGEFPDGEADVRRSAVQHDRPRRRYVVKRGPAPARLRHLPPIDELRDPGAGGHGDQHEQAPGAPWRRRYWIIERRHWYPGPWRQYYIASEDAPMDERSNQLFVHIAVATLVIGVALLVAAWLGR